MVERALKARRHRPMFMVDLAVPRDIEQEVGELDDVFLYTRGRPRQRSCRRAWMRARRRWQQAEAIIDTQVRTVHALDGGRASRCRSSAPCATRPKTRAATKSNTRCKLLARGDDPKQVLEALSHGLTNKLLHAPTQALNEATGEERRTLAETLARLLPPSGP